MIVDEQTMLKRLSGARRVFLLEPPYRRKYPPLGLAKIARFVRDAGGVAEFGREYSGQPADLICVTSLFTFQSAIVFDAIDRARFLGAGIPILVGGVFASLMTKRIDHMFPEIEVFPGYSPTLDCCPPDYEIDPTIGEPWSSFSYVFTSRGCPNKCFYCSVWRIEPGAWINPGWRHAIAADRPNVMISDNNLSACDAAHIAGVIEHCVENRKRVVFDNGFDCKRITPDLARLLARLRYTRQGMRLAFDRIDEDGTFQRAVELLKAAGVPRSQIMAYVLFNYKDTPEEANYRMSECVRLGIKPYPQKYEPLNQLDRKKQFVGKHWNPALLKAFRYFWLMAGLNTKMSFADYCDREGLDPDAMADPRRWRTSHFLDSFEGGWKGDPRD